MQPQMSFFRTTFNRQSDPGGATRSATHVLRKPRSSTTDSKWSGRALLSLRLPASTYDLGGPRTSQAAGPRQPGGGAGAGSSAGAGPVVTRPGLPGGGGLGGQRHGAAAGPAPAPAPGLAGGGSRERRQRGGGGGPGLAGRAGWGGRGRCGRPRQLRPEPRPPAPGLLAERCGRWSPPPPPVPRGRPAARRSPLLASPADPATAGPAEGSLPAPRPASPSGGGGWGESRFRVEEQIFAGPPGVVLCERGLITARM